MFGENFPYTNFHDLNMDWIIKIAKDFLDQYTHIQQIIEQGKTDIHDLTESGLAQIGDLTESGLTQLQEKADALEALLQQWYDTHSGDIADQLADALADLNDWYTTHQNYLDQTLQENKDAFDAHAEHKAETTIATIPDDYTDFFNDFHELKKNISFNVLEDILPLIPHQIVHRGITWTIYPDGTFTANGTSTGGDSNITLTNALGGLALFDIGVDYFGNIESSDSNVKLQVIQNVGSTVTIKMNTATSGTRFSFDSGTTGIWLRLGVDNNTVLNNVKGKFSIVKESESENNTIKLPSTTTRQKRINDLLARRFINRNEYDTIAFQDMGLFMDATYILDDFTFSMNASHKIMYIPACGITEILFDTTNTNSNIIGAIAYNNYQNFTPLKLIPNYLCKLQGLFPKGLPEDAVILFNWLNGNTYPSSVVDSVKVKYGDLDHRITCGRNKFNKYEAIQSSQCNYSDGNFYGLSAYSVYAIPVEAGDVVRIAGTNPTSAHVVFKNKYGTFIEGYETDNSGYATYTAPANSAMCVVSVGTSVLDNTIITINDSNTTYEPYHNEMKYKFYPYTSEYIYKLFKTAPTPEFGGNTNNNTAYLKLPGTYSEYGNPTPLVILCHGASKGISPDSGWTQDSGYNSLVTALNNAGFAVIDSSGYNDGNTAGHDHWSCPQALAGYVQAYDYFTTHYNLEKTVCMYGFSMGGLTALNLMKSHMIPVKCAMIAVSVVSLYDQCVTRQSGGIQNPYFLASYNIFEYDRTKLYGCDRYLDLVQIGTSKYVFQTYPPLYIGYGLSDDNISNEKLIEYYTGLYNANKDVRIKGYTGGHNVGFGASQDLITDMVNWFSAH